MLWSFDRTGFPLVNLPDLGWLVHLLPVSKLQFERFIAEPPSSGSPSPACFGDSWYEHLLEVSPRVSVHSATPETVESLFMTGLEPAEVEPFARWLGPGFELPRVDVWRAIDDTLRDIQIETADIEDLLKDQGLHSSARTLLARLHELKRPKTWGQLMLLTDGVLEWVRSGHSTHGGLGRPRREFQQIIINPQRDAPVRPIREGRQRHFGIRLTRPLSAVP